MIWTPMRQGLRRMDWALFGSLLGLMALGVLFIYSASYRGEDVPMSPFYQRQILWCLAGICVFVAMLTFDYHRLAEGGWWLYAIGIVLLVLVLLWGRKMYGSTRWLVLFGVNIQPSEFAKFATLICVARYLSRPGRDLASVKTLVLTGLTILPPFVLILKEPDLGTASVLIPMAFLMLFAVGVPLRRLGAIVVIGLVLLPFAWFGLGEYQQDRLLVFFDPDRDPLGAGWNKMQSEIAVGSGGLTGKGYLKGTQNVLGFLPRTVAPTDFIFSVIAEEMGFAGSALVMTLYAAVLTAILRAALVARDRLGRLLCVGVASVLFGHVFVNIAMTVGLMPITGIPLPLISYGGSFTVSTMAGLGMVQSVYVRRYRR